MAPRRPQYLNGLDSGPVKLLVLFVALFVVGSTRQILERKGRT